MLAEKPEIAVSYTFSEKDVEVFYRKFQAYYRKNKHLQRIVGLKFSRIFYGALGIVYLLTFLVLYFSTAGLFLISYSAAFVVTVLTGFISFALVQKQGLKNMKTSPGFAGEHDIRLRPDGLSDKTDYSEWKMPWSSIVDVIRMPDYVLFCFGGTRVFPIPRTAFFDETAFNGFYQRASNYWQAAQSNSGD